MADPEFRRLRLRYAGICVLCGATLPQQADALYHAGTRTVRCLVCPPAQHGVDRPLEEGIAGASAQREFERRKAMRSERVRRRIGSFLGGIVLSVTDEPASTRAWERGASGERNLAEALVDIDGLQVLHDRRVPGTRGNIDHLIVAPAGVFVVDAKLYAGLIRVTDRGDLFTSDERLYVGRRDCSKLAEDMSWQVEAVRRVLDSAGLSATPVTAVLCFVEGEWPLFFRPKSFRGVQLEGTRSIRSLVSSAGPLDLDAAEEVARILARAFPQK